MYSPEVTALITEGAKNYSRKEYDEAYSKYADACAEHFKESGTDCPDLLLLYGKALYQSGLSKSGVLGGTSEKKEETKTAEAEKDSTFEAGMVKDETGDDDQDGPESDDQEASEDNNAINDNQVEDEEEEKPEFEEAWEVLDLARNLFEKRTKDLELEAADLKTPYLENDKDTPKLEYVANLKKLCEVHALLGEISLETESFPRAASDLAASLELRQKLYDSQLSSLVSENHFTLSLALEFCGDSELRKKAAEHTNAALDIVKAKNKIENDENEKKENDALIAELSERYDDLIKEPEEEFWNQKLDIMKGILGEATSDVKSQKKVSTAVQSQVNDLSSMVKKRKAQPGAPSKKQKKQ